MEGSNTTPSPINEEDGATPGPVDEEGGTPTPSDTSDATPTPSAEGEQPGEHHFCKQHGHPGGPVVNLEH